MGVAMRPGLPVDQFRAAGIYLNGGRKRGWRKRIARLLNTPEATIAAWASQTPSNARPIPGAAAVAVKLLVAMLQRRETAERNLSHAAEIVTGQVLALLHLPEVVLPETETLEHAHRLPARMKPEQKVTPSSPTARSNLASRRQRSSEHAT